MEEEDYFSFYANNGVGDLVVPHWIVNFINTKRNKPKRG